LGTYAKALPQKVKQQLAMQVKVVVKVFVSFLQLVIAYQL
jgi:hypothetical protein